MPVIIIPYSYVYHDVFRLQLHVLVLYCSDIVAIL